MMDLQPTHPNNKTRKPHIVIVGGGMVGLSLARLLTHKQAADWSISLVEQHASLLSTSQPLTPSFDARATALSAGSQDILQQLGLWADLQPHAEAIHTIDVSDRGHYGNTQLHREDHPGDALGYVVENRHIGRALVAGLSTAVTAIAPAKVVSCTPKICGHSLRIQRGSQTTEMHADLVVIADGAESQLRQQLGIDANKRAYYQSAIIANVVLQQPHRGIAYERFTDQGPVALLPLQSMAQTHRAALVWTLPTQQASTVSKLADSALLRQLQQRFGYRAGRLLAIGERHSYPLEQVTATEQIRSALVVIGNAAHTLHPVAGQGFNLSLRDCVALSDVLSSARRQGKAIGDSKILQQYSADQRRDQDLTIALTDQLIALFGSKNTAVSALRQVGLMGLTTLPQLKHTLTQKFMRGFR
ncbi:MAG: 2-octaprenyl-6-methoxyphenyl hydroxylase [Cellvibrionaceae bacterium]|nr:2-octaprenyl-6-methoxyphenyl hydroxylase [Cellvibrionaceae bacterium]